EPVVVLGAHLGEAAPGVAAVVGLDVHPGAGVVGPGVVLEDAATALERVDPAVRAGLADVVLGPDHPALLGGDHAGDLVTVDVGLVPGPVVAGDEPLPVVGEPLRLRARRGQ